LSGQRAACQRGRRAITAPNANQEFIDVIDRDLVGFV
jgi:hypothetical protein